MSAVVKNEQGIAIIIVLILLLLLSILGASVLSSTTSDLRITGNSRNIENAFFAADAALEYAESSGDIYSSGILTPTLTEPNPSWPGLGSALSSDEYHGFAKVEVGAAVAYVKVDYQTTGPVPAGMGTEVDSGLGASNGFMANYYVVSVIGKGTKTPTNPNSDSRVELESEVIKIVPKGG